MSVVSKQPALRFLANTSCLCLPCSQESVRGSILFHLITNCFFSSSLISLVYRCRQFTDQPTNPEPVDSRKQDTGGTNARVSLSLLQLLVWYHSSGKCWHEWCWVTEQAVFKGVLACGCEAVAPFLFCRLSHLLLKCPSFAKLLL